MKTTTNPTLEKFLNQKESIIIDGGLATHLEWKYGCDLKHRLWSSRIIEETPEVVRSAHKDFLDAGAQAVITCTYRTNLDASFDWDEKKFLDSINRSVQVAKEACEAVKAETGRDCFVIGSVGTYGSALGDGTTYSGNFKPVNCLKTVEEREQHYFAFHKARMEALIANPDVDIIGIETIPRLDEC